MGGKSRLRKWLLTHFNESGYKYLEPFVGLGNVFFQAKKELNYKEWYLGDINVSFLLAVLNADLDKLPNRVNKIDFDYWKNSGCFISKAIEPAITFAGKGYKHGFDGGHPSHPPYNGELYLAKLKEARYLLNGVVIKEKSWDEWDYSDFSLNDFIYFDPPYFETKASYPNIDHVKLVGFLNTSNFCWALSGYDNELYRSNLKFSFKCEIIRNSEIKSSNTKKYEATKEMLWVYNGK